MRTKTFPILMAILLAACTKSRAPAVEPAATAARVEAPETLAFDIREGDIHNAFFRRGPVAAHVLATRGAEPRILFAFPAGNSGAVAWFKPAQGSVDFDFDGALEPVERPDGLRGVAATLRCGAQELTLSSAVQGSIRTLRSIIGKWETFGAEIANTVEQGPPVVLTRTGMDGKHRYVLMLEPLDGATATVEGETVAFKAEKAPLRLRATALNDEEPLHPLEARTLLNAQGPMTRDLQALAFLSYQEKLLAGSWRFLTYFGRDTLLSTRLLMPALRPEVIEAALGSVLERLASDGDVAHEEEIGDFAAMENAKKTPKPADVRVPGYDYKMIDDDLMLAPIFAEYAFQTAGGKERAAAFLARKTSAGTSFADALRKNLALVVARAEPFAKSREPGKLLALKPGITVGQWRDSNEGLGFGRYAFDVNAALMPAALSAAARLYASPLLNDPAQAEKAGELGKAWQGVEDLFRVEVSAAEAAKRVTAYAKSLTLDAAAAVASLQGPVRFRALALDEKGRAVPVMHTDDGFVLLFGQPGAAYLEEVARNLLRPFPAGLTSAVGVVVANPAYSTDAKQRALFGRERYHGTVVWSWQQALLASGLRRQIERSDLPAATTALLKQAEAQLWQVILAMNEQRTGELWSWDPKDGRVSFVPFGQGAGHHDESNAAQLWSTVYLAVKPPPGLAQEQAKPAAAAQ